MRRKREADEQVSAIEARGRQAASMLDDAVRERDALQVQISALSRQIEELSRQKEELAHQKEEPVSSSSPDGGSGRGEQKQQQLSEWEATALSKLRVLRESGEGRVVLVRKSDYEAKRREISRLRLEISSLTHSLALSTSQASSIHALSASAASANDTLIGRSPNNAVTDTDAGGMNVTWDVQPVSASASPSQRVTFDGGKGASMLPKRKFDIEYDRGISRGAAAATVSLLKTGAI